MLCHVSRKLIHIMKSNIERFSRNHSTYHLRKPSYEESGPKYSRLRTCDTIHMKRSRPVTYPTILSDSFSWTSPQVIPMLWLFIYHDPQYKCSACWYTSSLAMISRIPWRACAILSLRQSRSRKFATDHISISSQLPILSVSFQVGSNSFEIL